MRERCTKLCEGYMNKVHEIPNNHKPSEHKQKLDELKKHINDNRKLLVETRRTLREYLVGIQVISNNSQSLSEPVDLLAVYRLFLLRERSIYANLNKFRIEDGLFFGFCWIPTREY
mmetsp:Transcript_61585/g.84778  ORF Transcript_61585/g.84778 Transcript_61585/m.84778 type:complete len:116 (-) Transcript_61585:1804-2151(-)